jgi:predicted metallo-beta-lactamase superfamily hydrolase
MAGPLIYIGTYTVKNGKLEECKQRLGELVDLVETNEPRLIAFHIYLDEQASTISVVQVHPDSDSMEFHLKVVSEHLTGAFEYLEATVGEQLYGSPSDTLADMLQAYAEPEVAVSFIPVHEVGFTRATVR